MDLKEKCDVIIPVYNAPEWLKLCVYSLFINTPIEYLGRVYLMNDNSNSATVDCLNNLKNKYPEYIELVSNEKNLGFVKNVNKGLKLVTSKYILLLNTDCLVSRNTIPKLISHIQNNSQIGLICPISSNAANLTLEIFDGFSYTQMDALLEKKFVGKDFDACTVVGNCLMITKECLGEVGLLDEAYGMGYGEETDYHFRALSKGFKAKVAIDTYVFHKSEVSFGNSKKKQERLEKNRELFFSKWGKEYEKELKKYNLNDPIRYVKNNITKEDKHIVVDTLFYLPFITQQAGGCHVVVDIVNYLVINGFFSNILYEILFDYREPMLFKPISREKEEEFSTRQIVSTLWISAFGARQIALKKEIPIINFVQGYENYFENGANYNSVELTHKIADYELTISQYLHDKLKNNFGRESFIVNNGINYDVLFHKNNRKNAKNITFVLRDNVMKGDFISLDIIKQIDNVFNGLNINVIYMREGVEIPFVKHNALTKILGPLNRSAMGEVLKNTDIYVDSSLSEGFGLIALEAMACGAVPIVSNSFGVLEYMKDGRNGFVINEVNNSEKYVEKIALIVNNERLFDNLKRAGEIDAKKFDFDFAIKHFIEYFSKERNFTEENKVYTKEELKIIRLRTPISHRLQSKKTKEIEKKEMKEKKDILYSLSKYVPKSLKRVLKRAINYLYGMYDHSNQK